MRQKANDAAWRRLSDELKAVHVRHESSFVNLHFHIKTALITAFAAG